MVFTYLNKSSCFVSGGNTLVNVYLLSSLGALGALIVIKDPLA